MVFQENVPLAQLTTLGVGGPARWFAEARSESDIAEAADFARARGVQLFVLGGGSNVLVRDEGFDGVVLRVGLRGVEQSPRGAEVLVTAAAGEDWDHLVERSVDADCAGIECLSGIPGTVGATPVQNVGAYGQEIAETMVSLRAYDLRDRKMVEMSRELCGFRYRESRFNRADKARYVITSVTFALRPGGAPALRYADLERHFAQNSGAISLGQVRLAVREIRHSKGMLIVPGEADSHSAGSFFRNPIVARDKAESLAAEFGKMPQYPAGGGHPDEVKLSAAWLVERAGFAKGYTMGRAGISSKHSLALVNRGGASAAEIMALRDAVVRGVEERFGITLEPEPVQM
jgi:UDP-N-acetylmuramate dehydrogenase